MDGLYDIPDQRNYALYDYQPRDLGIHPEEDKISNTSKVLAALFALAHAADWAQTQHISRNPDKYYEDKASSEIGLSMGNHPSRNRVNSYMIMQGITNGILPLLLPSGYREAIQSASLGEKISTVNNNRKLGIRLR